MRSLLLLERTIPDVCVFFFAAQRRQVDFEHPFVRLIHLLAHHPDFEGLADDVDEMKEMAKYVLLRSRWLRVGLMLGAGISRCTSTASRRRTTFPTSTASLSSSRPFAMPSLPNSTR